MVEALKNCPDSVTVPILVGLLEEQAKSSLVAQASVKFGAFASMFAATSMAISAISLAIVSGNVAVGIGVFVLMAMVYIAIMKVSNMRILDFEKPDLDSKSH
ncbi:hypothetical protein DSECCO2_213460 [anaerobic digester metagenome]